MAERRVALVMGVPYATDLLYHAALEELQALHPRFTYLPTLSRERQRDGSPAGYVHERVRTSRDVLMGMRDRWDQIIVWGFVVMVAVWIGLGGLG